MMPTFGLTDGTTAPTRFIRLVNKEISKAEILLKVTKKKKEKKEKRGRRRGGKKEEGKEGKKEEGA